MNDSQGALDVACPLCVALLTKQCCALKNVQTKASRLYSDMIHDIQHAPFLGIPTKGLCRLEMAM